MGELPLENPLAGICRLFQMVGLFTQKGESEKNLLSDDKGGERGLIIEKGAGLKPGPASAGPGFKPMG
jgi:hypothetical protein